MMVERRFSSIQTHTSCIVEGKAAPSQVQKALFGLLLACVWLQFLYQVHFEWVANPQYQYGFFVPFLAAYLLLLRIRNPGQPPQALEFKPSTRRALVSSLVFLGLLAPLRLVQESNPEWRAASWFHGVLTIGFTLSLCAVALGRQATQSFVFPVFFVLSALPWPSFIEAPLTNALMRISAETAVEFLNWRGVSAWRHGNIIEMTSGMIGVNEACSGVRSLQSGVMIALFWGEWHRLPTAGRIAIALSAPCLSLALNLIRTLILASVAASHGPRGIDTFHDPAGWTVAAAVFVGLWALAKGIASKFNSSRESTLTPSTIHWKHIPKPSTAWMLAALLIVEVGVHMWYRPVPGSTAQAELRIARATSHSTNESIGLTSCSLPQEVRAELRSDSLDCFSWKDWNGTEGRLFLIQWNSGRVSALASSIHRPEICLASSGYILKKNLGTVEAKIDDAAISCQAYLFEGRSAPIYVFFGHGQNHNSDPFQTWAAISPTIRNRLRQVLNRRPASSRQVVELAVSGCESLDHAIQIAGRVLSQSLDWQSPRL